MVILDNLADFQALEMNKSGMILSIIVLEGSLLINLGGTPTNVCARDILICPPGTEMSNLYSTPNFKGLIFGMSYMKFQKTVGPAGGNLWSVMMFAREHPVYHMTDDEQEIGVHIFYLFEAKLTGPRDFYYKEVMQSLMATAFYEVSIIIERNMKFGPDHRVEQKDLIFRRFMELVSQEDGRRRTVADYARFLCISPKYLSAAVKAASGKSALVWIHESTVDALAKQLRHSPRTIKEIAGDFGFSSLSAFGKFVRMHLGDSPREYRQKNCL